MRGGARKGAGRKPRPTVKESFTVRLDTEDAAKFRLICKSNGRSQSKQLTVWIRHDRNRVNLLRAILELAEDELITRPNGEGTENAKIRIRRAIEVLLS